MLQIFRTWCSFVPEINFYHNLMLIQIHQHGGNKVRTQTEIIEIPRLKTPAKLLEDEEKPEQHLRNQLTTPSVSYVLAALA